MGSAFEAEFAAVAVPDLLSMFGVAISRQAAGAESPVACTALITRMSPEVNHHHGRERAYERTLEIASTVMVAASDIWTFDGFQHTVVAIQDVVAGLRKIKVQRIESDSQHEARSGKVL